MNKSLQVIQSSEGSHLLLVVDGESHVMRDDHKLFHYVLEMIDNGRWEDATDLVHNELVLVHKALPKVLADGLTLIGETLYYNDKPLYPKLTQTVLQYYDDEEKLAAIGKFIGRLMENPSRNSREQLYTFLDRHDFRITDDGHFIAYKGLKSNFLSIHSGDGVVNGVEFTNAQLDNSPGNVVTMPRQDVMDDPASACSFGLHAGSMDYARSFADGKVVEVKIDPADVVSVPHDSSSAKIRTCRYEVLREVDYTPLEDSFEANILVSFGTNISDSDFDGLLNSIFKQATKDPDDEDDVCGYCGDVLEAGDCDCMCTCSECGAPCEYGDGLCYT